MVVILYAWKILAGCALVIARMGAQAFVPPRPVSKSAMAVKTDGGRGNNGVSLSLRMSEWGSFEAMDDDDDDAAYAPPTG